MASLRPPGDIAAHAIDLGHSERVVVNHLERRRTKAADLKAGINRAAACLIRCSCNAGAVGERLQR